MVMRFSHIAIILMVSAIRMYAQVDLDPPASPVLDLVSVDHLTGNVEMTWTKSTSSDVSGYVIYLYKNGEGYELDTIYNPAAVSYIYSGSGSNYYSESFVVAALDTAGNISPLSNELSTIHTVAQIDTCNKRITVSWNRYSSVPRVVLGYSLYCSVNGGALTDAAQATPDKTSITIDDFEVDAQYCFYIKANLSGGSFSGSNKTCLLTKMQRPPEWINADYATIDPFREILLSFTIDPLSEIRTYSLERKTGYDGDFTPIYSFNDLRNRTLYTDSRTDISKVNFYRLKALNNCNNPIMISNIASNIVLSADKTEEEIILSWNKYRTWGGINDSYKLFIMTGTGLEERYTIPGSDTTITLRYEDLMYEATLKDICFLIRAMEASNPYTENGTSSSSIECIPVTERISVPTIFTPDNNSVNDLFKPFLSFTPLSFKLVITDLRRRALFETTDFNESWDGTRNGEPQPEGVYLWFLNAKAPSGKEIIRTGSVTLKHNH
jgi:gliding motility-associated-like protein